MYFKIILKSKDIFCFVNFRLMITLNYETSLAMDRPCTTNGCQLSPTHSTQLDTRREEKKRKTKRNMETYHREGEEKVWFRIMDRGSKISPLEKQMERTCFQPYSSRGEKELSHDYPFDIFNLFLLHPM